MIKSVFIGLDLDISKYEKLGDAGANDLIVWQNNIDASKWDLLQSFELPISVSFSAFDKGSCPLSPSSKSRLKNKIKESLGFKPKRIWLDHFRFHGYWEGVKVDKKTREYVYKSAHRSCKWCKGKVRGEEIAKLAKWTKSLVPKTIPVGYFAVPFKLGEHTKLVSELGQDHRLLGKIFDIASPMLYHRMIKKPVSYISEYVKYLHNLAKKPVLPIIQIKDMPDNLPDKLSWAEIKKAYKEASESPSIGVAIFVWEHAVEKNKVDLIAELFSS